MSDAVAPDLTRKVLGYRAFDARNGLGLKSLAVPYIWTPGVNTAHCVVAVIPHAAPVASCVCGLYAYHTLGPLLGSFTVAGESYVVGVVLAWGRIEAHLAGFRSEYAEIAALVDRPSPYSSEVLLGGSRHFAKQYGVETLSVAEAQEPDRMRAWGERIPDSLLPTEEWMREMPWPPPQYFGRAAPPLVMFGASTVASLLLPVPEPSRPPLTWLYRLAITLNAGFAAGELYLLASYGRWWSALAAAVNLAGIALLVRQRRRLWRKYRQG